HGAAVNGFTDSNQAPDRESTLSPPISMRCFVSAFSCIAEVYGCSSVESHHQFRACPSIGRISGWSLRKESGHPARGQGGGKGEAQRRARALGCERALFEQG